MKFLYFHIPKTAGSSLNDFFANHVNKYHFHIEGVVEKNEDFFKEYDFLSGHVSYTKMNTLLDLKNWITFATFREPISYAVSHLKWIRKLADPGEEKRLKAHPKIFQKIALEMTKYDFSLAKEIEKFIDWLESINFYYLHNTQMHYMHITNYKNSLKRNHVQQALNNMRRIDFIGIQEEMDSFMDILSYEFGWSSVEKPYVNKNENSYGFNISCEETRKALYPLYEKDLIIYKEAKKLFNKQKRLYQFENSTSIRGVIDRKKNNTLLGWVRFKESLTKVKLDLKIDDTVIASTTANIFRQGLKTKGIHPTGCCGFKFTQLHNIDLEKCKIYVHNTDIEIQDIIKRQFKG